MNRQSSSDRDPRVLPWVLLPLLGLGLAASVAAVPAQATPEATESAMEAGAEEDAAKDDYEWFPADVPNLHYRIDKVPKIERAYKWIDDTRVKFPGGAVLEVVDHDEEWFWVKVYEWIKKPERKPPPPKGPSEEELQQVAADYRFDDSTVDVLRFEDFDRGLPRSGQWRNGFDVADMNGDGHQDIVFGVRRKGPPRPNIFLGDGQGGWKLWREARFPRDEPFDYGDAAVADFNGDGHSDVAFGIHLRGLLVLVGDGQGGFQTWSEGIAIDHPGRGGDATSFSSRAIDVVDWNGDGRPDLIALGEGPKGMKTGGPQQKDSKGRLIDTSRGFVVYLNQGDGTWKGERPTSRFQSLDFGDDFVLADFNRDRFPDLVSATNRLGNRNILSIGNPQGAEMEMRDITELRPSALVSALVASDFDGDGRDDLVVGYRNEQIGVWRTGIDLLFSDGEFGWRRQTLYVEESRKGVPALGIGDLDGNGVTDLVGLTGEGELWVFVGNGQGKLSREASPELPASVDGCRGFDVHLEDLDGDGRDEVVASFAGEQTGYPGLPGLSNPGCPNEGSIRAWKATPAESTSSAPAP